MARTGDIIDNPITGERITFLETAKDTDGELLRLEYLAPPHAPGPPLHVHPYSEERFDVLSGTLTARLEGNEQSLEAGRKLVVAPGTPHTWRNDGEEEIRVLVELRPALRMEEVFETTFNLARDGKTDERGLPKNPLRAVAMAREYADETRLTRPPFAVQKVLLGVLAPVLRLLRYEGRYPQQTQPLIALRRAAAADACVGRSTVSKGSIYRNPGGEAEIMAAYDDAPARLGLRCESQTVGTRFGETHVLVMGPEDAPPVMVLHGGNFLNPFCLSWFAPLADSYRLYAPDIVGQPGKSSRIRPSPRGDGHAQWAVDVLDALDLGSVPFVGVSYGAGITLRVAGYAPERISKAALVSPSAIATGPAWRMVREVVVPMLLYMSSPNHKRLLRAARPILTELEEPYVHQLGAIYRNVRLDRHLPRMATGEELAGFEAPTLIFACGEDVFFPGEAVERRAREIVPNLAGVEVLEGCRHVPSRRALEHVNAKIAELLRDSQQPTLLPGLAPHQRRVINDRVCPQRGAPETDRFLGREGAS